MTAHALPPFGENAFWEYFLADIWQQQHLHIPRAFTDWQPPLDADELAGLALEPDVESRLVDFRDQQWYLSHGPFQADDFERANPWTLLVQAVDQYLPEVAALRRCFDALPTWRLDDVMVSYASDGGSVGPHYDNYDVFLLQGEGFRRWRIGQRCDATTELAEHAQLRLLENFESTHEYRLGPGDMLYVPPGVAHWGVAEGDCTTFSIGFRAPRVADLLSRRLDAQLEKINLEQFFEDSGRAPVSRAGEITEDDRARVCAQLAAQLAAFEDDNWFGELVTEPRESLDVATVQDAAELEYATRIALSTHSRLAWQEGPGPLVTVFGNGSSGHFERAVLTSLITLCAGEVIADDALAVALECHHTRAMIIQLIDAGVLHVE